MCVCRANHKRERDKVRNIDTFAVLYIKTPCHSLPLSFDGETHILGTATKPNNIF